MLQGQGLLKSRCCLLLSELRVLLLGPHAPSTPLPPSHVLTPVGGGQAEDHQAASGGGVPMGATVSDNNNTLVRGHHQPAGGPGPGWVDAAELSAALRVCSSSPEERTKGRLEERYSMSSFSESGFRTPVCRICFQGPEYGELLSPCRCCGSVRCTHHPCLIRWISERGSWACELCYYKYQVIAISTKNPLQWQAISLTMIEKVQIAAAVLGSLFLMASISWLVWSSFSPSARWQRQDLLFQICYGMYGFMDIVCIALIIHEGPSVFRIFHRWQAVNQQWKVLNYDKSQDREDLKDPAAGDRTLSPPGPGADSQPPGVGASSSTVSLMVGVSSPPGSTVTSGGGAGPQGDPGEAAGPPDQHGPYNILNLLSHLRAPEPRGPPSAPPGDAPRELVMRVTTV
ncbi:membrane associated ring-CH-type finger 4b [Gadus chalcogrammus]|uniref:membrane associated ring-CH-type finger 4b n=1 Tax=Gadus chalcogrammus TaxID=1042646 RepID=UPI0024C48CB9|nr:membrane associated ring-CH-type finger 4b [Gadus chalcogrammus]